VKRVEENIPQHPRQKRPLLPLPDLSIRLGGKRIAEEGGFEPDLGGARVVEDEFLEGVGEDVEFGAGGGAGEGVD